MKQHRFWFMDLLIVLLTSCSPMVAVTTQPPTAERMQNPTVLQIATLTRMLATITRVQLTSTSTGTLTVPPTPAGYLHTAFEERSMRVLCQAECRIDPNGNPSHEGVEKSNFLLLLQKSGFDFWRRLGRGKAKSSCATQFEGVAHIESLFFNTHLMGSHARIILVWILPSIPAPMICECPRFFIRLDSGR